MSVASTTIDQQTSWRQMVAKAWADPAFKSKLLTDPAGAVAEAGFDLPPGLSLHVHEASPTVMHLVLPPPPADELDDAALQGVAGGAGTTHHSTSHNPTTFPSGEVGWAIHPFHAPTEGGHLEPGPRPMIVPHTHVPEG